MPGVKVAPHRVHLLIMSNHQNGLGFPDQLVLSLHGPGDIDLQTYPRNRGRQDFTSNYRTWIKLDPFALQTGQVSGGAPNSMSPQTGHR
jgi:hypothetical protein